jgi:hypothetical protein
MLLAAGALALPAAADEIRLKDGKKLYGVIVAYEDNMFKVKTDFGYVLVEKDKIAAIIPTTPAQPKPETKPAAKKVEAPAAKAEPAVASASEVKPEAKPAKAKDVDLHGKPEKVATKETKTGTGSTAPVNGPTASTAAATTSATNPPAATAAPGPDAPAAAPKEPEAPVNREEIQGNLYVNHTYGFRMYKAPSWELLEDARQALPHAIVAMGTSDESTLLVVGREKLKTSETLDAAAKEVEEKLSEVYANYRRLSEKKTAMSGLHAKEIRYRGTADGRDWSGRLVTIARGNEVFTVLGMTYADDDLIQIQENVIARAIASLDFAQH